MPIGTILFFVVIAAGVAFFVFLLKGGSGPDWAWRLGRRDPIRIMFFREDGSWRRYGKLFIFLWNVVFVLLVFFVFFVKKG